MSTLPTETYEKVKQLAGEADALAEQRQFRASITKYAEAIELLPVPTTDWEAATYLLAGIGDANFAAGNYNQALLALQDAMHCPGAIGNPFLHLRIGQCQFELGEMTKSAEELTRAYMGGGTEIFDEEDSKYFCYLKTVIKPPASGVW